jgi:glutamine synthetase
VAAVLTASRLGLENNYELSPVESLDSIENSSTDVVVPSSLKEALDALEADDALVKAFSTEFVDGFVTVKRAEWSRYETYATDWEINEYLPFL